MRILSFKVSGFANFLQPVALAPLEDINVLHGPNDVGKSNLLRAMELYFRLLGAAEGVTRQPVQRIEEPDARFLELLEGAFNRQEPEPIKFLVNWSLPPSEIERWGIMTEVPCAQITTELELKTINRAVELRVERWLLKDQDISLLEKGKDAALVQLGQQLRRLLADATPFQQPQPVPPYRVMPAEPGFSPELCNGLFDARQSLEPETRRRWSLFAQLAGSLRAELGDGEWDTAFDRRTGKASLVFVNGGSALLVERLGAGIQQFLALLARLVLAKEPWVAFEEPEWRLSPEMQQRFVALAGRVLEARVGPRQLFLTTHSPVLGNCGTPFSLVKRDGHPVAEPGAWNPTSVKPVGGKTLNGLIGLVEELAEIEPEQLAETRGTLVGAA